MTCTEPPIPSSLIKKLEAEIARFPESEALPYKNGLRKAIAIVREHKQTMGAAAPYSEKDPIEDGYWPKKSKTPKKSKAAEPSIFPTDSVDSWFLSQVGDTPAPEPVSVSLEKCCSAIDQICDEFNDYEVCPDNMQIERIAKAVLDAAGVKYVN